MGEYYIRRSDELYHYGVKGMRWGVRHDPERSSNGRQRKSMSTAKKVAIGVGVAAAVAGVTYAGVRAHHVSKYNKAARGAVQRAIRQMERAGNSGHYKVKPGPTRVVGKMHTGSNGLGTNSYSFKPTGLRTATLTGHSRRYTKAGAALNRASFYDTKVHNTPLSYDYMTNSSHPRRIYESKAYQARMDWRRLYEKNDRVPPATRPSKSINRLKRRK